MGISEFTRSVKVWNPGDPVISIKDDLTSSEGEEGSVGASPYPFPFASAFSSVFLGCSSFPVWVLIPVLSAEGAKSMVSV